MMLDPFDVGQSLRPSTPVERLVIVWCIILGLIILAGICLWLGYTAPPAKATQAGQLRTYGFICLGIAAGVWVIARVVAWILDR